MKHEILDARLNDFLRYHAVRGFFMTGIGADAQFKALKDKDSVAVVINDESNQ